MTQDSDEPQTSYLPKSDIRFDAMNRPWVEFVDKQNQLIAELGINGQTLEIGIDVLREALDISKHAALAALRDALAAMVLSLKSSL